MHVKTGPYVLSGQARDLERVAWGPSNFGEMYDRIFSEEYTMEESPKRAIYVKGEFIYSDVNGSLSLAISAVVRPSHPRSGGRQV